MRYYLFIILVLTILSCSKETEIVIINNVDSDLQPYVTQFYIEAQERGIFMDQKNLIASFKENINDSNGQPICGVAEGKSTNQLQYSITIDPQCLAWTFDENSREILVFHELGHALLGRMHDDDLLKNNDYKSIMFGGNWNVLLYYTQDIEKRTYYIDELFNSLEPSPIWAN